MKIPMETLFQFEEIVVSCGRRILRKRAEGILTFDHEGEGGRDFATTADLESLKFGLANFRREFPGVPVIAEEQENNLAIPESCIVFDPLDGTISFHNGSDDFGVTACLFQDGLPYVGVTYFPVRDIVIYATRGGGCYMTQRSSLGEYIRIKSIPWHGKREKIQIGTDVGWWNHKHHTFDMVLKPLSQRYTVVSTVCAIEGARRVLFGQTAAYYNISHAKIWDAAAMSLAIEEAGGVVCAPDGTPLKWNTLDCHWVMAINPDLANIVLQHTKELPRGQH